MKSNNFKSGTINEVTNEKVKYILQDKEFREVIQYFITNNSKGENGVIVKKIRENHSESDIAFVEEQIDEINKNADDWGLWRENALKVYVKFSSFYKKTLEPFQEDKQDVLAKLFILFTMNYVFVSYKNKRFRNFIDVKKRSFIAKNN